MITRILSLITTLLLTATLFAACAASNPTTEANGNTTTTAAATTTATSASITAEQAQSIALADAGLTADEVTRLRAELDRDDGKRYYDVQFDHGTTEYDYDIDADSGAILEKDIDID